MMNFFKHLLFSSLILITACAYQPSPKLSLYQKLGERPGITELVDRLLYQIAEDPDVLPLFAETNIERFREKMIEKICVIADGPCTYSGDNMADTHRNMAVQRPQFNSVVEDLIRAMEQQGFSTPTQNALLDRLVPLYPQIVQSNP